MTNGHQHWHLEETYKSLITISVGCLKILVLVNGGAAVAVLTYLGNLNAHTALGHPINVVPAVLWYCGGLMAAVLAFILAYLVQLQLYAEESATVGGKVVRRKHQSLLWGGIGLCFLSAIAFGIGCWLAADAFWPSSASPVKYPVGDGPG
jgi:hypothetical protein